MSGLSDFLFGRGALKKAAGQAPANSGPAQPAGIDIAAEAQKMASRAKGNDSGIGARGSTQSTQPNDRALKSRANSLPAQKPQPNDVGMKGGNDEDD